ncbi:MAG TPA: hypothetical protein VJZ31_02140 [Bacilli bacterium]|nr:hypothetical protein [Bacilli bacterium]
MQPLKPSQNKSAEQSTTLVQGSFASGFVLAYFLSLIGLIIALFINKPQTTKGAIVGTIVSLVTTIIGSLLIVYFLMRIYGGGYPLVVY